MTAPHEHQRLAACLDDWLFALLRFAVTHQESDRMTALTLGAMLDTSGVAGSASFRFFARASAQVCAAIADRLAPESRAVLRSHVNRIDNPRLARAFASATGLENDGTRDTRKSRAARVNLWRGLDVSP